MRLVFLLLLCFSCKEFYDEEYEEDQLEQEEFSNESGSYEITLRSTDPLRPTPTGDATIEVADGSVDVSYNITGVPSNFIQLHYAYVTAPCQSFSSSLGPSTGLERSFSATENLSLASLAQDLASSGAATTTGDTNLIGKRLIIRGVTNFSGTPNPTGTNQLIIACGDIVSRGESNLESEF